jgi:pimeloyl-[acyl-carrier protein] methyl ester esterase
LRAELDKRPHADLQTLRTSLDLLLRTDQREVLHQLDVPLFGIFGERDTLVPAQITGMLPAVRSVVIKGAGHAPFISHARQCSEQLRRWLLKDTVCRYAAH